MSGVRCFASKCKWNDIERDECTKPNIHIKPNIDNAEPAFCDDYSDTIKGVTNETKILQFEKYPE